MTEPKKIKILQLEQEAFKPFGRILAPQEKETPEVVEPGYFDFYVSFSEFSQGWQIGYLINEAKSIEKLERHPNTPEVFSPLSGNTVLVVSENPHNFGSIVGFTLSKPIVFNRGVWHGVISVSGTSEILIVENPDVIDEIMSCHIR